jgi:2-iminobutanoate/2-iminopropanoate deaminase
VNKIVVRHPEKTTDTGAYSSGILCDGWLYVSGHAALDLKTGEVVRGTIEEQTSLTLCSIEAVLSEGGCSLEDVVKCTCFLARIEDFDRFDREYSRHFRVPPARTTVQSGLGSGLLIEIDAIARVSS